MLLIKKEKRKKNDPIFQFHHQNNKINLKTSNLK